MDRINGSLAVMAQGWILKDEMLSAEKLFQEVEVTKVMENISRDPGHTLWAIWEADQVYTWVEWYKIILQIHFVMKDLEYQVKSVLHLKVNEG